MSNEFVAEKDRRLPKTHLISGSLRNVCRFPAEKAEPGAEAADRGSCGGLKGIRMQGL